MSVTGRAEAYDRHTGRYGPALSAASVRFVGIEPGMRVLDVGCGPGAPTKRLAHISALTGCRPSIPRRRTRTRADTVCPAPPSASAPPKRCRSTTEASTPCSPSLVIQALDDAPEAAREMHRVTAASGVVAACVWDFRGGMPLLRACWAAAGALDPMAPGMPVTTASTQGSCPSEVRVGPKSPG